MKSALAKAVEDQVLDFNNMIKQMQDQKQDVISQTIFCPILLASYFQSFLSLYTLFYSLSHQMMRV